MSSLEESIKLLEADLTAEPPRISVYHDLPFAIFRYDPDKEWTLRREIRLLSARLGKAGKTTHPINMSDMLWQSIEETEGIQAVEELEKERGYLTAQEQITTYLSDKDWRPLTDLLAERMQALQETADIIFLIRTGAMAPGIYQMSKLLDEMQGRSELLTILFYPGTIEGTTGLRFMALKERETMGNYRVKIYG